jgi:hypothetical protein
VCKEKTFDKIKSKFYWPNMRETVESMIRQCDACAARKMNKSRSHAPLGGVQTGAPMERVAMDILGPLPLTYQGNRYVLVVMDLFTKWTEAYPLPDQEAKQ